MRSFQLENSMWLVKRSTRDFETETSSVNEAASIQSLAGTILERHKN